MMSALFLSDGLWDVISSETTCWVARVCLQGDAIFSPQSESTITVHILIAMGRISPDNICIITRYNYLKPYVISKPEITFVKNNVVDECLILVSDGLWDVLSSQMACRVARHLLEDTFKPPDKPFRLIQHPTTHHLQESSSHHLRFFLQSPVSISKPEITFVKRKVDDECFILASDGLWDVVSSETTCWMARVCLQGDAIFYPQSESATTLHTRISMGQNTHDNISIIRVDLMSNWEVDVCNMDFLLLPDFSSHQVQQR
ncbi:hypothetical protein H5410_026820 [Solanum commersonii]|uniref:PPM-type phosphatase domain-containing protein n=1 Tax=Solanum commersonii TaxID=4109 RepID=A0A9J5Z002_SOLCO|nr:hypothetical protein H5410_026820 [Solanum commersonii]